jgi:hypothetical protein
VLLLHPLLLAEFKDLRTEQQQQFYFLPVPILLKIIAVQQLQPINIHHHLPLHNESNHH